MRALGVALVVVCALIFSVPPTGASTLHGQCGWDPADPDNTHNFTSWSIYCTNAATNKTTVANMGWLIGDGERMMKAAFGMSIIALAICFGLFVNMYWLTRKINRGEIPVQTAM